MKIEQTFTAGIIGVGQIESTEVDLPGAVELSGKALEIYSDMKLPRHMKGHFVVPLSVANIRLLGGELYKTARVSIVIETDDGPT